MIPIRRARLDEHPPTHPYMITRHRKSGTTSEGEVKLYPLDYRQPKCAETDDDQMA